MDQEDIYTAHEYELLSGCTLCPRQCGVNRFKGGGGYCGIDAGLNITSVCIHRGEEPPISGPHGICNLFFAGCNLRCAFCQNYEVSRTWGISRGLTYTLEEVLDIISAKLGDKVKTVGFVSPSHVVPQVSAIIRGLKSRGLDPITVYNTNSYEKPEVIDTLDGLIDVYLPDYKYASSRTAAEYSDAKDYPEVALQAIRRMYYQKGSTLPQDAEGRAESGMIIRHLILPGHAEDSKRVLRNIAGELSPGVHLSLMSQYYPTGSASDHPEINRILYREEYESVIECMLSLGFRNVRIQDMESYHNYRPDFSREHPFE